MQRVHNQIKLKDTRRKLRRQSTPLESKFWYYIRNHQLKYKFRRQHSIGPYIVDFYCPKLKLIIEIDGDTHVGEEEERRDAVREMYLKNLNFSIVRYQNRDILNNIDGVGEDLFRQIELLSNPT